MGIGLLELVVIAVAALVLLGPQKLPEVLKQLGRFYVQLRRTSTEFKSAFDHVVRQAEEEARIAEIKRLTALAQEQVTKVQTTIDTSHLTDTGHLNHAVAPVDNAHGTKPPARSENAAQAFDHIHTLPTQNEHVSIDHQTASLASSAEIPPLTTPEKTPLNPPSSEPTK